MAANWSQKATLAGADPVVGPTGVMSPTVAVRAVVQLPETPCTPFSTARPMDVARRMGSGSPGPTSTRFVRVPPSPAPF